MFVVFVKQLMMVKLREMLAQAILMSDMRLVTDADKIKEDNVRPIYGDAPLYAVNTVIDSDAANHTILDTIDIIAGASSEYRGSGSPVFFCPVPIYTAMMLVRDANEHRHHRTKMELASALMVSDVVPVPPMGEKSGNPWYCG